MMGESEHCVKLLQHVPDSHWGSDLDSGVGSMCENEVSGSETFRRNLSWMNPGIAIVENARVTREETHH